MVIKNPYKRLKSTWGAIDLQHNRIIASEVTGRVLDIGCGYGSLVNYLSVNGHDALGVDSDKKNIQLAKNLFPNSKFIFDKAENLKSIKNNYYESIVLKDSLHHIIESDSKEAFKNFRKKLRKNGTLVILDPNPVLILKIGRKLVSNNCPQISVEEAKAFVTSQGFSVKKIKYFEILGILFSGGYIGYDFTFGYHMTKIVVSKLNEVLSNLTNFVGLGKVFCWRYIIVAKKNSLN